MIHGKQDDFSHIIPIDTQMFTRVAARQILSPMLGTGDTLEIEISPAFKELVVYWGNKDVI